MQLRKPDQQTLAEELLQIEERIALCREHIEQQQAQIAQQLAKGEDPEPTRRLLGDTNNLLAINMMQRDRLKAELDELLG